MIDSQSVISGDALTNSPAKPCMPFWSKTDLPDGDHVVVIKYLSDEANATQPSEFYFYGFEYVWPTIPLGRLSDFF